MISPASSSSDGMSSSQVDAAVAMSVLRKSLDAARQQGAAAVELIDAAGQTGAPRSDPLAAKASGLGSLIDITA